MQQVGMEPKKAVQVVQGTYDTLCRGVHDKGNPWRSIVATCPTRR